MRPLVKRFVFAAIATVLGLATLEITARLYAAVRFHHPNAWTLGSIYVRRVLDGSLARRDDYPFAEVRRQEEVADEAFLERRRDTLRLTPRTPSDGSIYGVSAHRNRWGFRGADFDLKKAPGSTRIVAFGESFVFGPGVRDDETWPYLAGLSLARHGARVEVVNAGVLGANIHRVLTTIIQVANSADVDYAVVVSAFNNHALLRMNHRASWTKELDYALYNLSMLYVLLREKLTRVSGEPIDYALYVSGDRVRVDRADVERLVDTFRRRLTQIATVCDEHHIRLVLAAQPEAFFDRTIAQLDLLDEDAVAGIGDKIGRGQDLWRMELEFYLQGRFDLEMKKFAEARGLLFFDAVTPLPPAQGPFFLDQIHLNAEGNRRLAGPLAELLAAHLAVER